MKKLISALLFSVMIVSTVSPTYAAKFKPTGTYYISRNDSYIDVFKYQGQLAFTPHPKVGDYSYEFRYETDVVMNVEKVTWRVKRIQEADYGCEERPEGEKTRVIVTLTDGKSGIRQLLVEDDWLYEQGIDEGSKWPEGNGRM